MNVERMNNMNNLGYIIKKLRKENNLTQKELGDKLNVGKSTISQYENNINTPDIDIIKKISKIFDVSVDYLLGNTDIRKNDLFNGSDAINETLNKILKECNEKDLLKLSKVYEIYKDLNLDELDEDDLEIILENAADSYKKIIEKLKK
ncbi:helix-turn-helix transcriptional regulator [Clostridium botulinum]|uniref:Helix-turn-helix transcriptional regulator n=2 Tax=Clostridium botulinum TaxID=1491 RepID=A0A6G4HPG9_CLOBO|nr:XRE family transcriptional regulator [Clostridium botulinum]NFJ62377.1 helix-turn-helix transcriptional regulator [Clostridium botulinum]NFQ62915.1 helix-turn-helix transcriptional regulator [Clostridium botulinum]NFR18511.1 helix-turn-helix transcriptional regulator [Clostridium botulinum]NFU16940.1 helix-turn-helix transcriptional regulator [Clostridium botulinum]